jgi:hypothetical protein
MRWRPFFGGWHTLKLELDRMLPHDAACAIFGEEAVKKPTRIKAESVSDGSLATADEFRDPSKFFCSSFNL